jgi:eukaryotic-like serine/threonine-protein kinase
VQLSATANASSVPAALSVQESPMPSSQQSASPPVLPAEGSRGRLRSWKSLLGACLVLAALVAGGFYWRSAKTPHVTEKDTILLSDFVNTTGDPVFDDALKQALAVSLQQSPFLSLVSNEQVLETLRYMGRPSNTPLTQDVAREVCQRMQSKAMLTGTISQLGSQYLVTLEAMNCSTGASLLRVGADASAKDNVLPALGKAASELRGKLGESLASIQKFDAPLPQATTSSLEALKAYSLAARGASSGFPARGAT